MDNTQIFKIKKNKRIIGIVVAVFILLLFPIIAMQFTDDVNWSLFDFIVAAVLLFGTGFMLDLFIRKITNIKYLIASCVILLVLLALIWGELAVGIFGTPFSGS